MDIRKLGAYKEKQQQKLTMVISGRATFKLQIGVCGGSPLPAFGSFINAMRPMGSACGSLTLIIKGNLFS